MPVTAPTLISPSGPGSPWDPVKFRFPQAASSAPDRYDIQITTDKTFAAIDLWHYTQQTAGLTGWTVWAPYLGATPVIGQQYYWRARGRLASEIGPWSTVTKWRPDPIAVSEPYADWSRDILEAWAEPRPVIVLGSLLPSGPEVLQLVGTEYAGRWRVRDDRHPPSTDQLVAVYGISLHVDFDGGWEIAGITSDVPPGEV